MNNNCLIGETPLQTVHDVAGVMEGYADLVKLLAQSYQSPALDALCCSMKNSHSALKNAEQALEEMEGEGVPLLSQKRLSHKLWRKPIDDLS